jgi:hypothetical protein
MLNVRSRSRRGDILTLSRVLARPDRVSARTTALAISAAAALVLSACGSSTNRAPSGSSGVPGVPQPTAAAFAPAAGRNVQQLARSLVQGPHAALANSVFLPGRSQRVAFGLIDDNNKFVYAQAAVYIAPTINAPAQGPFPAPLDSIVPSTAFRSQTTANDPAAIKAVYYAHVPLARTGPVAVLVVSRIAGKLYGSVAGFAVTKTNPIPNVGQAPPLIDTPTVSSVGGNVKSIDTRVPPDDMHDVSFKNVLGKRPVALIFATPQLCQSRVCGPVVDLAEQFKSAYGNRVTFIHQEVYANNTVQDGLRPQLKAFHLQTEPWLFTLDRRGRIVGRLEGSFGVKEFQQAIQAALSQP